jgi:hypothetical protein
MLTIRERIDNTTPLTLEERKEILERHFRVSGGSAKHMTERGKDNLVKALREAGYYPPMFDFAMRLLLSSERAKGVRQ